MSGGKSVSLSKKSLQNNLDGIYKRLGEVNADINLIQEVDFKSSRTWKINIVEKNESPCSCFSIKNWLCE